MSRRGRHSDISSDAAETAERTMSRLKDAAGVQVCFRERLLHSGFHASILLAI